MVKGDSRCYAVACSSISAKVIRSGLMRRQARRFPVYGWEHNCGYATLDHIAVVDTVGMTPHHRRSFRNKQQFELLFDEEMDVPVLGDFVDEVLPTSLHA